MTGFSIEYADPPRPRTLLDVANELAARPGRWARVKALGSPGSARAYKRKVLRELAGRPFEVKVVGNELYLRAVEE